MMALKQDKPTLIFDYDGTIADTFTPTMEILAADYKKWGDRFNKKYTINELRGLPIKEIVKTIPGGWWKFSYLLWKSKRFIRAHEREIKAYPGIVYTLRTLHNYGFKLLIVTSNQREQVERFLRRLGMEDVFSEIAPTKGLLRKAKTLRRVMKKHQLSVRNTYYVGDEIRDIEACKKVGLPIISVSYGFNSSEGLRKFKPTHLIKKPTQLLQLLG
jgi:phosphoglycolate phosphatase